MKKALTLVVLIVTPTMAFAQGTVLFQNATGLVKQWTSTSDPTPCCVPWGGGSVQLIAAPKGTLLPNRLFNGYLPNYTSLASFLAANPGWAAAATRGINLGNGLFNGGGVTITNIAPGGNADYFVIGWTGGYATLDAAIAAASYDPTSSFLGMSAIATTGTGNPLTLPVPGFPVSLRSTFQGMTLTPVGWDIVPFSYMTNNGAITITGYFGPGGAVTVPSRINGLPVTSIEYPGFRGVAGLTSVTIPNSVNDIRGGVFEYCTNLSAITVDALNYAYSTLDGVLFNKNQTTLIQCPGGKAGSYIIPNSVTGIVNEAFLNCASLTSVTIGTNVTSIGGSMFYDCTRLASVTLPNSVTNIGDQAFAFCTSLTSITIPNSVNNIGDQAFGQCSSLTSAIILSSVTNIGGYAFYECSSLTNVTIPSSITSIGDGVFQSCTSLLSITIPNSVTSLGSYVFWQCTGLTNVMIPSSVTSIGYRVFYNCTNLTSITIPSSVTSIGDGAFSGCTSLTSATIPSSLTNIAAYAFSECTSLTNVTIPSSVTNIGIQMFASCTSLVSVTLPNSVTSIGDSMFYDCTRLASVTIPDNVTNIGDGAFCACSSLTSVTIPNNVTSIGPYAFWQCTSLRSVYFKGNAPSLADSSVFLDDNATVYYLPGTTGWGSTFGGCPTVLWNLMIQASGPSFGIRTNHFCFNITGASNLVVVVEACTNFANPIWSPVATNTQAGGWSFFSDPNWPNYTARFYRLRSP